jgi:hypothetical protein
MCQDKHDENNYPPEGVYKKRLYRKAWWQVGSSRKSASKTLDVQDK